MSSEAAAAPFSGRAVIMIVAAALVAFAGFAILIAFAPQWQNGHNGRGHALSVSGNGFAGLVALTDAIGSHAVIVRDTAALDTRALLVVTPEVDSEPTQLKKLLAARGDAPTLVILPKWTTRPLSGNRAWSQRIGLLSSMAVTAPLAQIAPKLDAQSTPFPSTIPIANSDAPRTLRAAVGKLDEQQRLAGSGFVPILLDHDGRTLIGRLDDRPVFVLADPDLLDNQGLADAWTARQGWAVIDDLATTNEIAFDLTLNGFATQHGGKDPLRLIFQPPFLPVTLIIVAAGLLAGLHGAVRFGAPVAAGRAIAMGKRTLVDNAAMLFRAARREHRVGGAYAALTRDLAVQATHAPTRLSGDALDRYLDQAARTPGDPPYATLAWRAGAAEDRDQLLSAARALYRWRRNRTR